MTSFNFPGGPPLLDFLRMAPFGHQHSRWWMVIPGLIPIHYY